ncbi:MAG: 3-deoxy-manno-octulosonate cytidylyltransferase [Rhizobiales bacterium]|nr:3-deoxy-manno-octulosonate cytidylyltransferase [Hyphomicrobiales bacterium]
MTPLILIPSRLASTRLPGKPLADINGLPMIVQVLNRAREADIGRVVVAADHPQICEAVRAAGGEAVMTRADHSNGSDRIWEALNHLDPDGKIATIINVQGDLPTIDQASIQAAAHLLEDPLVDIATIAAVISNDAEKVNPNVVKVIGSPISEARLRALYFTRATAPYGDGPLYHHIGLYGYRRDALARYVALKPSVLEKRESLEQLRALEAGMRIDVALVDTFPLGVDTPADLVRARALLARS